LNIKGDCDVHGLSMQNHPNNFLKLQELIPFIQDWMHPWAPCCCILIDALWVDPDGPHLTASFSSLSCSLAEYLVSFCC